MNLERYRLLNINNWCIIYFASTRLIENLLFAFVFLPFYVTVVLYFFDYWIDRSDSIESYRLDRYHLDRYSLTISILKKEMKLIFIYAQLALLYTWIDLFNNNHRMTYMSFLTCTNHHIFFLLFLFLILHGYVPSISFILCSNNNHENSFIFLDGLR